MVSIERYSVPDPQQEFPEKNSKMVGKTKSDAGSISSGQTKKTTATTLTVRQSNVINSLVPATKSSSISKSSDPPTSSENFNKPSLSTSSKSTKSSSSSSSSSNNNNESTPKPTTQDPTAFYAPEAPLPTARQLAKVLCRIVDDEAYTRNDASVALQRLHQWALKQDVKFGNNLVSIGVVQLVLFFVEDHMQDAKAISSALLLLEALTTPLDEYESKAISNIRAKVSHNIVEGGGIELLLKAFAFHGLPEQKDTALEQKLVLDKDIHKEQDSLWNTLSSMLKCDENNDPLTMACGVLAGSDPRFSRNFFGGSPKRATDTAVLCMKVLTQVVPHSAGAIPDRSAAILTTVVDIIPKLKVDGSNKTPSFAKQEQEALVSSVMSCLVSSVKLANEKVLNQNKATAKQTVEVTVQIMREYPSHPQIVCDGCLILKGVCPHLTKTERKRYGVVAALGAVVASNTMMDRKVKEIADAILEEQFQ
jgi:hypothetical protein